MSSPDGSPKRLRLFIALELPAEVRRSIVRWGDHALADPALRPVDEQALHVTLAFLGSRPEEEVQPLARLLNGLRSPAPRVCLAGAVGIGRGRPRLFALHAESPEAAALQAELVRAGEEAGLIEPEKRPFWPHVTVARVRPERRGSRRPGRVKDPPEEIPESLREPFRAVRVTLYRSLTGPAGAEYVPLAQVELPERAAVR
jgi:2'-5' RNA ligase